MHRNHSSQLNQSFMIHNIHLIRRMQQLMDYMVSIIMDLDNIEKIIGNGEASHELIVSELRRLRQDMESVILSTRGRATPPTTQEMATYASGFTTQKPERKQQKVEEIEKDIKEILNDIFGGIMKKMEEEAEAAGAKDEEVDNLWRVPKPEETAKDDWFPDPEDLEDYLKGL